MSSLLKDKEDEKYKKKLEEARKLRQSMGIVTSRDIENGYDINENTISLNNDNDSEYQKRLQEAKDIRHSMGIMTPRELEEQNQIDNINFDTLYETKSLKPTRVEQNIRDNKSMIMPTIKNNEDEKVTENSNNMINDTKNNENIFSRTIKDGKIYLTSNDEENQNATTQQEENSQKNTNIFQDIGGFFKALFSGAKNGIMQTAHYIEAMNETNPYYNDKRTQQFLTSSKVSDAEKSQYKESTNTVGRTNNQVEDLETNLIKKYMEDKISEENEKIVNNANNMSNDLSKKLAGDILPSVGQMGVGAVLNVLSPGLGLSYFFTSAGGSYYDDAIQKGMDKKQAITYSTVMAGFEAITEELTYTNFSNAGKGIKTILGIGQDVAENITKKGATNLIKDVFKDYGLGIAENFIQEAVIEPLQEMSSQVISGNSNWDNMGERMLKAGIDGGIVSALVGGADIGINSCVTVVDKLQNGEKITNKEYKEAIQDLYSNPNIDIEKSVADSILYQINNSTMDSYYTVQTNQDGNVEKVQEYLGKPIENINRNLRVEPIVIRNSEQNSFNIIDKESGIILDSTPYQTLKEAENGFYKKTLNLDDATVRDINNKLSENRIAVKKFMTEIAEDITNNYQNVNVNNSNNETNNISNTNNTKTENSKESSFSMKENNNYQLKEKQLEVIKDSNPMTDDIHTGIRSIEDIKTFKETLQDKEWSDYKEFNPDYTMEMANEAINKGKITVYSSYPIEQGTFVTPSRMEAESYAGDGQIYSQEMNLKDIAWIDPTQGQVAITNNKLNAQVDIKLNKVYNKISNKEKSQIKSEVMTWRKNSSDGIDFIDLSKDGYFSYSYMKNGDDIQVLQKFIGDEDFIKEAREVVLNETYSESQGLNQYLKNVRSRLKNNTSNNASSSRRQKSTDSIGKNITDGGQQRGNNNTENISRNNKTIKDKIGKSDNIEYNSKGIRLNKTEYANVMSLINTNKPNLRGTQTISSSDYFYMYESDSFDNNKVVVKIKIDGNEDLINAIRRNIENGTINRTERFIGIIEKYKRNGRRLDNIDNDISQRTTKNQKINKLYSKDVGNGKETRQGQNSKQSNRNKPKIENSNQSSFSMQENNDNVRAMTQKKEVTKNEIKVDPSIQKELHNRIQNSLLSNNSRKNTFLGKVTEKVVNKVKQLYGIDISGRNHIISDYDIRHIIKQHGNPVIEKAKGQIAVTTKDIEKIPDIIINYDKIEKGTPNIDSFTKKINNTIRYIKEYDNNITYLVEVIPSDNNKLNIKTMWKKTVTLTNSQKTPSSTSKTRGNLSSSTLKNNSSRVSHDNNKVLPYTPEAEPTSSYSYDSISQNMENVKENKIQEVKTNAERGESYIEQEIQKLEKTGQWDDTIPVTKLRDINNVIEDYLGLGIKKGRFRERAFGIYKGRRDVIRVKEFKDIDTILHETGHALDIGKRIKIDKESIAGELINAIDRRGGYEDAQREIKLEEGFAEVIREYSIVPERARVDAPQTVAILEEMRKQDKEFDNFINKVQTLSYNYIHQNPQNRVQSNISIGERTDKKKWDKDSIRQAVIKAIWDKDYAIKDSVNSLLKKDGTKLKASENAYLLTRLASGIGNKTTSMLADGYIDENGNRLFPGLNKLGEILDNDPQRFNDLRDYLVSKRDIDYKSKTLKTGIRTTDSLNTINKFKNDTQIQEAAQIVYDTLDGVLQYAVNNNFISKETAEIFKKSNAFYVPMQRVLENDRGNNVGRRGAVQEAFKKRKGSELDIKDPLENIVANSANIIQQVENNNVLKALYKQGESVGLTGAVYDKIATPMTKTSTQQLSIWKQELSRQGVDTSNLDLEKAIDMFAPNNRINTNDKIANFIDDDGNRIYLQFNDKEVFNALMGIDSKSMSWLLKLTSKFNMPLRYGATMGNIGFAIPNMISDTVQATIYSEAGFVPIVDNAIGVLDVLAATNENVNKFMQKVAPEYAQRINNIYKLYQQSGASSSTRLSQYRKSSQELMPDIYGTKNSKNLGIDEKFKPLKRLLDIMTYIPELSEQSTRLRVFERNYDLYKKQGNSEMDSRIMAAIESRDATQDFGRMGTVTSEINKVIPFSAARMGSLYTFAEKIKANPKKVSFKIAILATLAMAIKGLGYDDKEIEELNQRKKDDNFVIKVGDTIMTFKKPQGILRSIVNLTEYIQDLATGHIESGKEGERLNLWLKNALLDNMPADSLLSAVGSIPIIGVMAENKANKDFYYNTEIVKSYDEDLPDYMQYYDYNSQLAIWLGKIFNYSPAKIDNLISGYFGGLGTQVTNAIDWISGKLGLSAEEPNMGAEENAIGKRFVVNVNSNSQSIDDIYNLKTELTKKQNGGNITEEENEQLENIKSAISKISDLNKKIKSIKQDLTMSANAKADAIRPLQEQKTDIARQALGKELIHPENEENIESLQFYPSQDTLKLSNYNLELTEEMKKEYENIAYTQYKKYESQGLYNKDYLKTIESKCKDYAKKVLMQKYKNMLVKSK